LLSPLLPFLCRSILGKHFHEQWLLKLCFADASWRSGKKLQDARRLKKTKTIHLSPLRFHSEKKKLKPPFSSLLMKNVLGTVAKKRFHHFLPRYCIHLSIIQKKEENHAIHILQDCWCSMYNCKRI